MDGTTTDEPMSINYELLRNFVYFFKGETGTMDSYRSRVDMFKSNIIRLGLEDGQPAQTIIPWVAKQVALIENLTTDLFDIGYRFRMSPDPASAPAALGVPVGNPALGHNSLPIDDQTILNDLVIAMTNGVDPYDMPNTAPLKHWTDDMNVGQMEVMAEDFLVSDIPCCSLPIQLLTAAQVALKRSHGNRGPEEVITGYTFQQRYDAIIEVLNVSSPGSPPPRSEH